MSVGPVPSQSSAVWQHRASVQNVTTSDDCSINSLVVERQQTLARQGPISVAHTCPSTLSLHGKHTNISM